MNVSPLQLARTALGVSLLSITLVGAAVLPACAGTPPVKPTPEAAPAAEGAPSKEVAGTRRDVDVAQLYADREAGKVPVLVDVRTPEEFAGGHVPGALNIPLDQVDTRLSELGSYQAGDVYLICQSGGRSSRAATQLAEAGFHAVNVAGGTGGWKAAGYPVE